MESHKEYQVRFANFVRRQCLGSINLNISNNISLGMKFIVGILFR